MKVFIVIITAIVLFFAITFPFLWLWNGLMPDIFGLKEITYWQAVGLLLLAGFLFKDGPNISGRG
jgi:hypothetical protein